MKMKKMKNSKILIIVLIILFLSNLFSIFSYADSNEKYDIIPKIDSILEVNLTIIDEFQAKIDMTHYYSYNKTYQKQFTNNTNRFNETVNLGVKLSLNNSGFIRFEEAFAETSFGEMKIISLNESVLETEEMIYNLSENDTVFYRISYYITGFAWGIPEINFIRIPSNFNLYNKNVCNQELKLKIMLPYESKINKNQEKYITFYGYSLEDSQDLEENFIDRMLSGNPLTLFYSKNQVYHLYLSLREGYYL